MLLLERLGSHHNRRDFGRRGRSRAAGAVQQSLYCHRRTDGRGATNTASSVNIKERLDFSCALFDAQGALIANAPHIPVHLGSMGASVQAVLDARTKDGRGLRRGDVYALNNPYCGGTHLPDLTVVMPVFSADAAKIDFFVAARGHHADIGGITPGSMPPSSRRLDEEGVLIDNFLLVENGVLREQDFRALLAEGLYPARNPDAKSRRREGSDRCMRARCG